MEPLLEDAAAGGIDFGEPLPFGVWKTRGTGGGGGGQFVPSPRPADISAPPLPPSLGGGELVKSGLSNRGVAPAAPAPAMPLVPILVFRLDVLLSTSFRRWCVCSAKISPLNFKHSCNRLE